MHVLNGEWPWITLALLGIYHGLNPGMGWLFAVSLGLQNQSRRAVLQALPPIALGHAASIAAVAGAVGLAQFVVPMAVLKWVLAALLIGFGVYKMVSTRHPRWVGMRVGFKDLTVWSFLMATAHGAGLMLVPVLLRLSHPAPEAATTAAHPAVMSASMAGMSADCPMFTQAPAVAIHESIANLWLAIGAVSLHTLSHLLVAGLVAVVVYEKLGLSLLRRAWFNTDYLWAAALIAAGIVAAFV